MKRISLIAILICLALTVRGQQPAARVAGLEKDARYMGLLAQEQALQGKEDSLARVLSDTRASLRTVPTEQRTQVGNSILRLESAIFEVRNQIGVVAGQVNSIEQDYIIRNLDAVVLPDLNAGKTAPAPGKAATFKDYLKANLPAADLSVWNKAAGMERPASALAEDYLERYTQMRAVAMNYMAESSASHADSLYGVYSALAERNAALADSISRMWDFIYDNKSYLCNLLMDKANNREYLASSETRAAQLRSTEAQLRGTFTSDAVGFYILEKRFVLESEAAVAEYAGDKKYADSLRSAMVQLAGLAQPEKIEIERRNFIPYQEVTVLPAPGYSVSNPIPDLEIFPAGTVYRIQLAAYLKPQLPSIFRNLSPLYVEKGDDGKVRYYAGGMETEAKAEEAFETVRKAGIRAPEIVVWRDGQKSFVPHKQAAGVAAQMFRVEISSTEGNLPQEVRDLVATLGEGKDISRIATAGETGTVYTFLVGNFDTQAGATDLADAIREKAPAFTVRVTEVGAAATAPEAAEN